MDLIDSPKAVLLFSMLVGNGGLQKCNANGHYVWYEDAPPPESWRRPKQRYIKTFTNLWAVPFNGGKSSLVPRSHRLSTRPKVPAAVCDAERCAIPGGSSNDGDVRQRLLALIDAEPG